MPTFQTGDMFIGVETGRILWYRPPGTLLAVIDTGELDGITGMAIGWDGELYATCMVPSRIYRIGTDGTVLGIWATSPHVSRPECIRFDDACHAYVSMAGNPGNLRKLNRAGQMVAEWDVDIDPSAWWLDFLDVDIANGVVYYGCEGTKIKRYDVVNDVQLADFCTIPVAGLLPNAYQLKLLPDGGLVVSAGARAWRFNSSGVQTHFWTQAGIDTWFGCALDTDGTHLWISSTLGRRVAKFTLATTNGLVSSFTVSPGTASRLDAICIYGEWPTPLCPQSRRLALATGVARRRFTGRILTTGALQVSRYTDGDPDSIAATTAIETDNSTGVALVAWADARLLLIYARNNIVQYRRSFDQGTAWDAVATTITTGYQNVSAAYGNSMLVVALYNEATDVWDYTIGYIPSGTALSWTTPRTLISSAKEAGVLRYDGNGRWSFTYVTNADAEVVVTCEQLTLTTGTFA
jgi:hypothetical protein